jgi:hypothetical protein
MLPSLNLACLVSLICPFLLTILIQADISSAFVTRSSTCKPQGTFALNVRQSTNLFSGPFANTGKDTEQHTLEDANGKAISLGIIVRVVKEGLKACQVPPKGKGSFDSDKNFVPMPEDSPRALRSLKLPVGIRGVVTKVYDERQIGANFPIQVKFVPGENTDEGYDPPVSFLMHFLANEIECV